MLADVRDDSEQQDYINKLFLWQMFGMIVNSQIT
jgi:hypothetical protein